MQKNIDNLNGAIFYTLNLNLNIYIYLSRKFYVSKHSYICQPKAFIFSAFYNEYFLLKTLYYTRCLFQKFFSIVFLEKENYKEDHSEQKKLYVHQFTLFMLFLKRKVLYLNGLYIFFMFFASQNTDLCLKKNHISSPNFHRLYV